MIKWFIGILAIALEPLLELIKEHTNSWIWGAIITASLLIFRAWEKRDRRKSSQRIEAMLRAIVDHLGVEGEWDAPSLKPCSKVSRMKSRMRFILRSPGFIFAPIAGRFTTFHSRREILMNLLSGKKKILTFILLVVLNGLNDTLQLHITQETITNISALGGGYIVVEGILDIVRAFVNRGGVPIDSKPTNSIGSDK